MSQNNTAVAALTIACSDSGGGAGLQADLMSFSAMGVFGTCAVTAITARSPTEVRTVVPLLPELVLDQIRMVCESFPIAAAKTGLLYSADIIRAVVDADISQGIPILVVDPIMVSRTGVRLLQADAIEILCNELLHEARVVTPNLHEAEILCGHTISSLEDLQRAAREIGEKYDVACVVKGGILPGEEVYDVLYDEGEEYVFPVPRIHVAEKHGAGCAFSGALTALLARGELICDAVRTAQSFVTDALNRAYRIGPHTPLNLRDASPGL